MSCLYTSKECNNVQYDQYPLKYNPGSNPSYDVGLWQINDFNWGSGGCGAGAPCDPTANLNCAIQVYKWGGNTWKNWATASGCGCANSP